MVYIFNCRIKNKTGFMEKEQCVNMFWQSRKIQLKLQEERKEKTKSLSIIWVIGESQRMTLADIKRIGLKVGRGLKVLTKVYKGNVITEKFSPSYISKEVFF